MITQPMNPAELMEMEYFELQKLANLSNTQSAALFRVNASTIRGWRSTSENKSAPKSVKATLVNIITGALVVVPQLLAMDEEGRLPALSDLIDAKHHVGVSDDFKVCCNIYAEHGINGGGFFESMTQGKYKDAYERAHKLIKPSFDAHMNYAHQFQALLPKDDPLYRPLGSIVYAVHRDTEFPSSSDDTGYVCDGTRASIERVLSTQLPTESSILTSLSVGTFDVHGNRHVVMGFVDDDRNEHTHRFILLPRRVLTA